MLGQHQSRRLVVEFRVHAGEPGLDRRTCFVLQQQLADLKRVAQPSLRHGTGRSLATRPFPHGLGVTHSSDDRNQPLAENILK